MEDELLIDTEHRRTHADFLRMLDLAQKFIGLGQKEDAGASLLGDAAFAAERVITPLTARASRAGS